MQCRENDVHKLKRSEKQFNDRINNLDDRIKSLNKNFKCLNGKFHFVYLFNFFIFMFTNVCMNYLQTFYSNPTLSTVNFHPYIYMCVVCNIM